MCGILGFVGRRSFDAAAFGRALDTMTARGPDDRGLFEEPECLLGHRRLAILDLSPMGHQPMPSPDGRYVTVFNGEVYNFRELREPLQEEGVKFRTATDTEVILALYAREGPDCLRHLRGMFALAIWDRMEKSLFLARDRMGIKPLYFWPTSQGLGFASEVRALRALPGGPSEFKPRALAAYLAWGSVPEPKTILKGVEALAAGTWATWKDGQFHARAYWQMPRPDASIHRREEAVEILRPLLRETVGLRCISDAPLGAFLSGGIDSSAIVSLMRASGQTDLRTFSMSFPQTDLDEGPFALKVAESFDTLHADISVAEHMVRSELDGFFSAMDQPTCDGVNTYLVSKFARQGGLTVSLSGLGGDELFAGYSTFHRIHQAAPWLTHMPGMATWAGGKAASWFGGRFTKLEALSLGSVFPPTQDSKLKTRNAVALLYYAARGLFMPSQIRKLLHPDLLAAMPRDWSPVAPYGVPLGPDFSSSPTQDSKLETENFFADTVHATIALELTAYMRNQLLRDSDVFGMANSLEIRVPFIDHRVVEAIFRIDGKLLLETPPKSLLLDSLPTPLPSLCTHRPKMGFTLPFNAWMRGPWRQAMEPSFTGETPASLRSVLRPNELSSVWKGYQSGQLNWSRPWSLYALSRL